MIDMDASLRQAGRMVESGWSEDRAVDLAQRLAEGLRLWIQFEPGDEEWVILEGDGPYVGMISIRFPLAVVLPTVAETLGAIAPEVVLVRIEDFLAAELRGSSELLRTTVLPYGWDVDFETEAFSANDLFVASV